MSVSYQLTTFVLFFILGIIISCIFDIFRTLRKIKKKNSIYVVMIQDIIFFIIITIVSIVYLLLVLKEEIRGYMFIAASIGVLFSRKIISRYLINFYYKTYIAIRSIFLFIALPIELFFIVIYKLIKKIVKKCCKLFLLMVNLKYRILNVLVTTRNKKSLKEVKK